MVVLHIGDHRPRVIGVFIFIVCIAVLDVSKA